MQIDHILSIYSSVMKFWIVSIVQLLALRNNATVNFCADIVLHFLECIPRIGIAGSDGNCLTF